MPVFRADTFENAPAPFTAPSDFVPATESPFADSRMVPEVRRPQTVPTFATEDWSPPTRGPATSEDWRPDLRSPVVEGTTMLRGAPGSGSYGERSDLTPQRMQSFRPLSVQEAREKGILWTPPADSGRLQLETPRELEMVNGLRGNRDRNMEMTSPAAQRMRGGFDAASAAGRTRTAMRASGATGSGKDIVARILGEGAADAASRRNIEQAQQTPQAVAGGAGTATYDPKTGQWTTVADQSRQRPEPNTIQDLSHEDLMGLNVKYQKPKRATVKELDPMALVNYNAAMSKGDKAAAESILESATQQWSPEAQQAQRQIQEEMRRRGLIEAGTQEDAGAAGGRKSWKNVVGAKK